MSGAVGVVIVSFLLALQVQVEAHIPHEVFSMVEKHFQYVYGAYLYFCEIKDAELAVRKFSVGGAPRYNVRQIPEVHEPRELLVDYWKPQQIGVFLDLTCDRGHRLLEWSSDLLNASYSWLLYSEEEGPPDLLRDSRLSVDSSVTLLSPGIRVYDLFRVHMTLPLIVTLLGTWPLGGDYQRLADPPSRTDFGGLVFNASLMMIDIQFNESNLIEPLLDKTHESGKDMVRRYGLSLFMHLAEIYNFSYRYFLSHAWGDPLPNGTITGMVGQLERGETEIGLAPAKYVVQRYDIIDYITSLFIIRVTFTFLQPKLFGSAKALVLPLDDEVWYSLVGVCFLSVVTFRILAKYDNTGTSNDSWGGSVLLVVGAVSQQGVPDSTEKTSTRIVYIFLLMVCFFVAVYYNTAILNGLLLPAPNAIQNIDQLLKSDIRLAVNENPYLKYETEHQNDSYTIKVRQKREKQKKKQFYFSIPDGVKMIKKGKFAMYTEDEAVYSEILHQMTDAEICSVSEVMKYNPFHVGAIARKNSPYKELFNRAITGMRERGVVARQMDHWTEKKPECHWRQDAVSLGMEPLALAYAVFTFGLVTALLCLGIELLVDRRAKNERLFRGIAPALFNPVIASKN